MKANPSKSHKIEQVSLDIGSVGQRLEAARIAKGVSVSEAGQATKILSKYITAMENDDFGVLSAPVYVKSFIRMYAKYLQIPSELLVEEYLNQHAPKAKVQLTEEVRHNLTQVDHVPADIPSGESGLNKKFEAKNNIGSIFGGVNEALANISSDKNVFKWALSAIGAIIVILIIIFSLSRCSTSDDSVMSQVEDSHTSFQVISDGIPDVFLDSNGMIDIDKK